MQIAIQGEPGSFSHEAALRFVPEATILHCAYSAEVFRRLTEGDVDAAAIPIENSLAGSVVEHYDLLLDHDVAIEREMLLDIHHNLIVVPGTSLDRVSRSFWARVGKTGRIIRAKWQTPRSQKRTSSCG